MGNSSEIWIRWASTCLLGPAMSGDVRKYWREMVTMGCGLGVEQFELE